MADPLGKLLFGGLMGYLFRRDHQAERRAERLERDAQRHAERIENEERKAIERSIRKLREEKRLLVMQRVYNTLVSSLSQLPCGSFDLPTIVGPAAITKIATEVTKLVAKELGRED